MPLRRQPKPLLVFVGLLVAGFALGGCGGDETQTTASPDQAEQAFLQAMVPHHESALEMAEVAERRAQAPQIEQLARDIGEAQHSEIKQMRLIHQRLFGSELVPDEAAHERLGLTAAEAGMKHADGAGALENAEPFDRAFVDEMIPHHQGAIRMGQAVLPESDDPELRRLAEEIIAAQDREVEQMTQFRVERYGAPAPAPRAAPTDEHEEH